ncbi:MAG: type VI secretion system baseplate subunit TssK, partial [Planctomycetes bacterium]|nr:type VI secretion system baseplate subunit TssK [Planctomycetota bacterium]
AASRHGPYYWGIQQLWVELTAGQILVSRAALRMQSGRYVQIGGSAPANAHLDPRPLPANWPECGGLDVLLGIPLETGRRGLAGRADRGCLYRVQTDGPPLHDENTADDDEAVPVARRLLNAQLFLIPSGIDRDDAIGFEYLKIGEVRTASELDATPVLVADYVPPLLDVTAHETLAGILREVCRGLRETNERLAQRPFSWAVKRDVLPELLFKLQATNTCLSAVEHLCTTAGVHPFDVYLALDQVAGALAIFSPERHVRQRTAYDHAQLGTCFRTLAARVRRYLGYTDREAAELSVLARETATRWSGALPRRWIATADAPQIYLTLTTTGLDELGIQTLEPQLKLVGDDDVGVIGQQMERGIRLERCRATPDHLRHRTGDVHYRIDLAASPLKRRQAFERSERAHLVLEEAEDRISDVRLSAATRDEPALGNNSP